jgi:hypothetical protein
MLLSAVLLVCFRTASACVYEYGTINEAAVSLFSSVGLAQSQASTRQLQQRLQ